MFLNSVTKRFKKTRIHKIITDKYNTATEQTGRNADNNSKLCEEPEMVYEEVQTIRVIKIFLIKVGFQERFKCGRTANKD